MLWPKPSLAATAGRLNRERSAERIQRLVPVRADFLNGSWHATLDRVALPQPVD